MGVLVEGFFSSFFLGGPRIGPPFHELFFRWTLLLINVSLGVLTSPENTYTFNKLVQCEIDATISSENNN